MNSEEHEKDATAAIVQRTQERFQRYRARSMARTDRLFARLLVGEWIFAIVMSLVFSPYGWQNKVKVIHLHVWIALILGAAIVSLPVLLAIKKPGAIVTRHVIASAQMLMSALFIHLSGGRIETHFHVFGSLAFLAFYLDWSVLVTAAVTIAIDHVVRGMMWPESVYGMTNPEWWRFLEHVFWVAFCFVVLVMSGRRQLRDWLAAAEEGGLMEAMAESEWRQSSVLDRQKAEK